ncbi:hypothetical protein SAMN06265219_109140 [Gracilimonas mengyeensis]|uniref:Uncharacterized protein n=2 Tax=Gracilimonas mengyeensis TaxID=1302730 RepID=A0A521DVL9_9BACT|nr:hypothetical protein SAMN06265219_109140 [Gracilimonas mengyeensis]
MLWNIFGWLGTGLVIKAFHAHDKEDHCAVSFCYCEIEDGRKICTCHHPELQPQNTSDSVAKTHGSDHLDDKTVEHDYCFYSAPHPPNSSNSNDMGLIYAKFDATCKQDFRFITTPRDIESPSHLSYAILDGFAADLLRPPRG